MPASRLEFRRYIAEMRRNNYEFSSTQVNLPGPLSSRIIAWGEDHVPDHDLYKDSGDPSFGRETEMHVTILYGLHDSDPQEIRKYIEAQEPFKVRLGDITAFTTNNKFDVIKIDASGDGLYKLNKLLRSNSHYTNNFPVYKPHVTIAYVRKGLGRELSGNDTFKGEEFTVKEITFSSRNGSKSRLKLRGTTDPECHRPGRKPDDTQ